MMSEDDTSVQIATGQNMVDDVKIRLGRSSLSYASGFRFTEVAIPRGAQILDVRLVMRYRNWLRGLPIELRIYGEDTGNAASFSNHTLRIPERSKTTSSVDWRISEPPSDTWFESPNIAPILQEVIDRGDWASGHSVAIFIFPTTNENSHYIDVFSYDSNANWSSKLKIVYLPPDTVPLYIPMIMK